MREACAAGGRGQRQDRAAAARQPRAAHEIQQPARAADLAAVQHLGVGLAVRSTASTELIATKLSICADHPHVVGVADRREARGRAARRPVVDPRGCRARLVQTMRPRSCDLRAPVSTPAACRSATSSLTSPPCRPRSRWPRSAPSTAAGTLPMPIWIVSPSSIRPATCAPIRSVSRGRRAGRERDQRALGLDRRSRAARRGSRSSAAGPRHGRVDLGHDHLRPGQHRRHEVHRDAEAAPAGAIGRRDLDQREVDRQRRPDSRQMPL